MEYALSFTFYKLWLSEDCYTQLSEAGLYPSPSFPIWGLTQKSFPAGPQKVRKWLTVLEASFCPRDYGTVSILAHIKYTDGFLVLSL